MRRLLLEHPLWARIILSISCTVACLHLAAQVGQLKQTAQIDPLDILGEGSALTIAVVWMWLILASRPPGRVTDYLYYGSLLLVISYSLDVIDEFIAYPESTRLMSWLESFPLPVGLLIISVGVHGWYQEQKIVNRQLRSREGQLRQSGWVDPLTTLYTKRYLRHILTREIALREHTQQPLTLARVNIRNFSEVNQSGGTAAGDKLLHRLSELLVALLRPQDFVGREHSDHFLVMLPELSSAQAQSLLKTVTTSLNEELVDEFGPVSFYLHLHSVTETSADAALAALNHAPAKVANYAKLARC